jgi:hypothetical protein
MLAESADIFPIIENRTMIKKSIFLVLALMVFAGPASAAAVKWTFGGPNATGMFTFDATTGLYSDVAFNIITLFGNDDYSTASGTALQLTSTSDFWGDNSTIDFAAGLTDLGWVINFTGLAICGGGICNGVSEDNIAGTVSAVPLPAAAWLFGSAILGLAGVARRKRA